MKRQPVISKAFSVYRCPACGALTTRPGSIESFQGWCAERGMVVKMVRVTTDGKKTDSV